MLSSVRLIEVEIHSHCNRKCTWCPNRDIDRSGFQILPGDAYIRMLKELESYGYKGAISYSRYNEPMHDTDLLKRRVGQAKELLPEAKLVSNTNGDFLTKHNMNIGIDELTIMDYDCIGMDACREKLKNAGVTIIGEEYPFIHGTYNRMKVLYYVDWPKHANMEDRGGSLPEYSEDVRMRPCFEPIYFIGIDYNGNVVPCCHIRSDNSIHQSYVLGNIKTQSLAEIYNGEKAKEFRIAAMSMGNGTDPLPCRHCHKGFGRYTRRNPGINY